MVANIGDGSMLPINSLRRVLRLRNVEIYEVPMPANQHCYVVFMDQNRKATREDYIHLWFRSKFSCKKKFKKWNKFTEIYKRKRDNFLRIMVISDVDLITYTSDGCVNYSRSSYITFFVEHMFNHPFDETFEYYIDFLLENKWKYPFDDKPYRGMPKLQAIFEYFKEFVKQYGVSFEDEIFDIRKYSRLSQD